MTTESILYAVDRGIATLTLNRPEVMNALNFDIVRALDRHLEAVRFDPEIRVVIVTGAGEKAFCAGADLKERATLSPEQVKAFLHLLRRIFEETEQHPKPVIAVDGGDYRFGQTFDAVEDIIAIGAFADIGNIGHIHAGAESLGAGPGHDNDPGFIV